MRTAPTNLAQGQAGTYAVASQLLLRGFNPCFPSVDIGADIILDCGVKIQVKSARLRHQKGVYEDGAYWFKLGTRVTLSNGKVKKWKRNFSEECDFVILWGIDANRFWIIPAAILDGHSGVVVGPKPTWIEVDVDAVIRAYQAGKTVREISEDTGLKPGTIWRCLNGRKMSARTSLTFTVRAYEEKWGPIAEYVASMRQANDVVEQVSTEMVALKGD